MSVEFEGDLVIIGDANVKLRMFKNKVIALENEVKTLKSQLEEKDGLIAEAKEVISRLRGKLIIQGQERAVDKPKPKKGRPQKGFKIRKNFIGAET
jgi:hypothetical protein